MNDDSGLRPTPAPNVPPSSTAGDPGRYRLAGPARANGSAEGRDLLLDRAVEIRGVGLAEADDLQREARFLARLEHPGIACVHDLVRGDGGALLVMREATGPSLAEAVSRHSDGTPVPELADPVACCFAFLKVCEAMMAAHDRGVVHRALGPDTIRFGHHGQVLVTGWSAAMRELERPATLRFVANAPLPATLPLDGLHEDIRAIGLCLYTALALQAPARLSDGSLAVPPLDVVARLPAALQAVVRKAIATDAAAGYRSVAELAADVQRFCSAQAPQAVAPSAAANLRHWLAEHHRGVLAAVGAVVLAVIALALVTAPRLRTYATWGPLLAEERFADGSWPQRWAARPIGTWEQHDGSLVTTAEFASSLIFRRRLTTPIAIEYTGHFMPGSRPCDLSLWWSDLPGLPERLDVPGIPERGYAIQAGAYDNSWCAIFQQPGNRRVAHANVQLTPGHDHRFRVEIADTRIRQWIDGQLVLEHEDLFPITSGYLGLYGYYPGKAFSNVRIWQPAVPTMISPLAIGDDHYLDGDYAKAAGAYTRVAESHPDDALGWQALFRRGIAERLLGDHAGAERTWRGVGDPILRDKAACLAIEDLAATGDDALASDRFAHLWNAQPAVRPFLRQRWQIIIERLNAQPQHNAAALGLWMATRERLFPDDTTSNWLAAQVLISLGRPQDVIAHFSGERRAVATAMLVLGRCRDLLEAPWATPSERSTARYALGRLDELLADKQTNSIDRREALCKSDRAEEALPLASYPALIYLGRADELTAQLDFTGNLALLALGRLDEAAKRGDRRALILLGRFDAAEDDGVTDASFPRLVAALADGRTQDAQTLRRTVVNPSGGFSVYRWFGTAAGLPLADLALGDSAALRNSLAVCATGATEHWGGRARLVARAALNPAAESELLAAPWRSETDAWLAVARALRGELAGDRAAAVAGWQAFAALPGHQRLLDQNAPEVDVEVVAAWRLKALRAP